MSLKWIFVLEFLMKNQSEILKNLNQLFCSEFDADSKYGTFRLKFWVMEKSLIALFWSLGNNDSNFSLDFSLAYVENSYISCSKLAKPSDPISFWKYVALSKTSLWYRRPLNFWADLQKSSTSKKAKISFLTKKIITNEKNYINSKISNGCEQKLLNLLMLNGILAQVRFWTNLEFLKEHLCEGLKWIYVNLAELWPFQFLVFLVTKIGKSL